MTERSLYTRIRQLDIIIRRWTVPDDMIVSTVAAGRALESLKRSSQAAVVRMRDYETSTLEEDVRMQAKTLPPAINGLEKLRQDLLKASEYELVSAIDVAQMSAELDEVIDSLR